MQDPKKEKKHGEAGFEKAVEPIHGIIDRIRALEHPDWQRKDEDISSSKLTLARYASELEHLKYRYEARGAELEKFKTQYTELEHKFLMRPDAMRRVGEMEVTELVKKKQDLAAQESSLERSRAELAREKDKLEADAKELVSARLEELERAYAAKNELLTGREEKTALKETEISQAEQRFLEHVDDERELAKEDLSSSFEHERAAARKEKNILTSELEKWRAKAEESLSQLGAAKASVAELESAAEAANEAAAGARQKARLAEMEKAACLKRLEEWEAKGPEFEKWRAELTIREENCRRIEEEAGREAKPLRERLAGLEDGLRHEKHEAEKWRLKAEESLSQLAGARAAVEDLQSSKESSEVALAEARQKLKLAEMEKAACLKRLEDWEKRDPELEKWRAELAAREESCGRIEENARREAQPLRERLAVLEDGLRQEKHEAEKWRLKAEESLTYLAGAKKTVEDLQNAAEASKEALAESRQRSKLADMEKIACLKRLEDWEKKGAELEKLQTRSLSHEERAAKEAQQLRERIAAMEILARESERNLAQAKLRCETEIPDLESKLKEEAARKGLLKEELATVKAHLDKALKESAALEEEFVLAKENHLKAEAQKDAERSKKMESLLVEMEEKERELEASWARRHKALEAEQKAHHAEFEKRHLALLEDLRASSAGTEKIYALKEAKLLELHNRFIVEFQDREAKDRAVEEELRVEASRIAASSAELVREYEQKSAELETVKREILAEMSGPGPHNIK